MEQMSELLKKGGKIIYVAPSGGRDRKNADGVIDVAPFDPQSLEMFILMAKKAKTTTHFHTLALSTYDLLPPPTGIQKELGEARVCHKTKIGFYFGKKIDLDAYQDPDKHKMREIRASKLTEECQQNYLALKQSLGI
jgi:glycerol-3-phosphate O-acyltransferase